MKTISLKEGFMEMFEEQQEIEGEASVQEIDLTALDAQILDALETGIEVEINRSLDNEIPADEISEGLSQGGFDYETTVIKAIRLAGIPGNIKTGAGANAAAADADIKIGGQVFNIEVKLDKNAQMGGSSVRFGSNGISLVKPMERSTSELLKAAVSGEAGNINRFVSFVSKHSPRAINKKVSGFPLACTKEAWEKAQSKKLLVNVKLKHSTDFIAKHYAKKGIFYIQIGGSGLFYLAGNPANLPIPKLSGDIDIEIRSARSGAKKLSSGIEVVGGGIRVQARLKAKGTSPYTADDPRSLREMLKAMASKAKKPKVS